MADPLRRTLSKLRGRRSQRGAAGAGEAAGHVSGGALQCKAQQSLRTPGNGAAGAPGTLLGSQAGCYRVLVSPLQEPRLSESAGWSRRGKVAVPEEDLPGATAACPCPTTSRREGTAPPPPSPPGLRVPPPPPAELCFSASVFPGGADSGSPAERAGGSEEDDYYDNQSLPGWGGQGASGAQEEARGNKFRGGAGSSHRAGARESTGRLRSQLQEAYYLLIHAMHDLPPASPTVAARSPPPTVSSPSRLVESNAVSRREGLQAVDPGSPDSVKGPAWRQGISKSLESLVPAKLLPLRRCRSDSALRSLLQEPLAPGGHLLQQEPGARREAGPPAAAARRPDDNSCPGGRAACGGPPSALGDCGEQLPLRKFEPQPDTALGEAGALAATVVDPAAAAGGQSSPRHPLAHGHEGPFKPPAVTVRKLQKWMYKGRLLSLGMKGRGSAAGPASPSPSKASGTRGLLLGREEGSAVPSPAHMRGPFSKALVSPSDQRILLTDLIENVYIPSVSRRELKNFKSNEMAECKPRIASITVSKKQNWLHQSSPRAPNLNKGSSYKKISGETLQVLKSPSPVLDPQMPQTFSKPLGHENPNRRDGSVHAAVNEASPLALQNRTLKFGEDNDADDEGEIWYNPIPEDDEPDLACFVHNNADNSDSPAMNCKISSPNDLIKVVVHTEGLPQSFSYIGDAQPRETSQVSCVHSIEHLQVQKPKPACGFVTEDSSTLKGSTGGPGILSASKTETGAAECSPSSPNPSKKGGSINWSFPDKIKSPRTVRKLSIKMKKLPELSRKLSVKGNSSHNSSENSSLLKNSQDIGHASLPSSGNITAAASRNVISRYHLDSSVSSQHNYKKKSNGSCKSSSKGGYLSDGDSPELITKSGKHAAESRAGKGKEAFPNNNGSKAEIDIDAFRHYSFSDQPKCSQYISGLMSIHFYGAEDLKPPRMDSKDVFCAIQVDSVNKARTALLTCRTTFLDMDHTFNIEIENAQHLKLVVFSWEPMPRKNRVCCHGTVVLPALFRVTKTHQLAVKLEPRGLIYVKLTLLEQWENSLNGLDGEREPVIFGVDVRKVVEKENVGLMVPLLMKKCIMEIEKRGCQVVGLYRLCGSAAVKKELREAFEKDSKAVTLCETQYPDINVITGVLKDYLRELPSPLITKQLYEAVLDAMVKNPLKMTANGCDNDPSDSEHTVSLLDCLPDIEKATLKMLLDHLKLVASYHEVNRMTCQNLAVCFGPVLLSQRQETTNHNNRIFSDSEELASALDFKKHIEVLHYLLQLWPVQHSAAKESALPEQQSSVNYLRPKKQRPQMLNLNSSEISGILRSRPARLDSPSSNRYAGDWSGCGENYFVNPKEALSEADYDDVPSEDAESGDDGSRADGSDKLIEQPNCMSKEHTFQAYLAMQTMDSSVNHKVNLKDLQESIDTLIGNLERELNKNKLNIRY
ncbi:rho GTPase-activating protein SYDE2 [Heteronotia binoei]|uniref:rho GTPase-activating protein SYDE2 n=1 Tax=Heteronotia binoei TaxID=13085 RepID=UPI00292E6629|nr:rho GTPase-activating protein SYDE2 [Heteronotia binoei]XP_060088118.1 rho GTPase-activating protein SYDE2 [Heteronotia binoei]